MIDAVAHPAGTVRDVVDPVRHGAPELGNDEVVDANLFGGALWPPFAPGVLEIADEF